MHVFCLDCAEKNNCIYNRNVNICPYYRDKGLYILPKKKKRKKSKRTYWKSGHGFWGKEENTEKLIELREKRYTQKEIAEIMGITKANVNVRVHQLLKAGEVEEIGIGNNYRG
jgi:Fic family protein